MEYYSFQIKTDCDSDAVWEALTKDGFQLLYSTQEHSQNSEDDLKQFIYGYLPPGCTEEAIMGYPEIVSLSPVHFDQIDWGEQWGAAESSWIEIDISAYTTSPVETLKMIPGPGFGDLSHSTTQIVLRMMSNVVQDKWVIDLGCGSGILSLAAIRLGALGVIGIDIDPEAIKHAETNANLNLMADKCHFQPPDDALVLPEGVEVILAMNMIYSEQNVALESLPQLRLIPMTYLTSGVLKSDEKQYLDICQKRNWQLVKSYSEDIWMGFHFESSLLFSKIALREE